jgi:hypothetical protein
VAQVRLGALTEGLMSSHACCGLLYVASNVCSGWFSICSGWFSFHCLAYGP